MLMNTNPPQVPTLTSGRWNSSGRDLREVPLARHLLREPSRFQPKPWNGQRSSVGGPRLLAQLPAAVQAGVEERLDLGRAVRTSRIEMSVMS